MVGSVPAAAQTVAVLRYLAGQLGPVPAASIARALNLPRSTTYALLGVLSETGFVVHLPEEHRFGLGLASFELGSAYLRQAPLARLARPVVARMVDRVGYSGHCAVLHGRDVLYVVEERAPGRVSLVSDVDVRLPAHLTASGRALLAALPAAQVSALFPNDVHLSDRTGLGPSNVRDLKALLTKTRAQGHGWEDGEITQGLASLAVAVTDRLGLPTAALAITFPSGEGSAGDLVKALSRAADELARRLKA